jgi:hypothetical protein
LFQRRALLQDVDRQPSLPQLAPGVAARALAEVEALRTPTPRRRRVEAQAERPLRTWGIVIGVAALVFLLLLALLYALSMATTTRPSLP